MKAKFHVYLNNDSKVEVIMEIPPEKDIPNLLTTWLTNAPPLTLADCETNYIHAIPVKNIISITVEPDV